MMIPFANTRRSPKPVNCLGRKPSLARIADTRGKSAKLVLAATARISMVEVWMTK